MGCAGWCGGPKLRGTVMDFPVYLLRLGEKWQVVVPNELVDLGHTDFWEQTVSHVVADYYKIPQAKLANLPYCQRRARVVGDKIYFGGRPEPELLHAIRAKTGNLKLDFIFDEHEKRLREDVLELRRLIRRHFVNDPSQPPRKPGQRR
jgi:hypothetical protein